MTELGSRLGQLECRACCTSVDSSSPHGTCPTCGHTLLASYALDGFDGRAWWRAVAQRPATLWRYHELLPVQHAHHIVSLGEGFSPILSLGALPDAAGVDVAWKDDGGLPTGSFKARGMAVAVSRAHELGIGRLFVPSAGNAGTALAAYGARAGLQTRVYLPTVAPGSAETACRLYGAEVVRTGRTIREAGEAARKAEQGQGAFDMSTLREPYRVEGKKTMGFEIVEQSGEVGPPDAVVYPAGGGTGLVGMYKAFSELRALGLVERSPRLYAVQADGCAPLVRALEDGSPRVTPWPDPRTVAPGLLVPAPFASERVLEAIRATHGGGLTVSDSAIVAAMRDLGRRHGISASPEAAAPYAALPELVRKGWIQPGERVLLYGTGTGLTFSADDLLK